MKVYGPPAGVVENGYLTSLTVEGKRGQEVVDALKEAGIGAAPHLPGDHGRAAAREGGGRDRSTATSPVARRFCESVVNLPLFYRHPRRRARAPCPRRVLRSS